MIICLLLATPQAEDNSRLLFFLADCHSRSRVEPGKRVSSSSSPPTPPSSSSTSCSSNSPSSMILSDSTLSCGSTKRGSGIPSAPRAPCPPHLHHPTTHLQHPYPPSYAPHYQSPASAGGGPGHSLAHAPGGTQYGGCYLGPPASHHHHFAQPSSSPIFSPYNR